MPSSAKPRPEFRCEPTHERDLRSRGFVRVAGIDEVGRGSLFGSVVAAAVVLSPDRPIRGLDDSKKLTPERREVLAKRIQERALAFSISQVDAETIDRINIYHASRLAMRLAVEALNVPIDYLLIDAFPVESRVPQWPIVKADEQCHAVAAASIIAKVWRDERMCEYDEIYPEYGLSRHKGYNCPEHQRALRKHGPTSLHRMSFLPVRLAVKAAR
jgi:ribonuclease HII